MPRPASPLTLACKASGRLRCQPSVGMSWRSSPSQDPCASSGNPTALRADRCVQGGDLRSMFVNGAIPTESGPFPLFAVIRSLCVHGTILDSVRLRTSPCLTFRLPGASIASHLTMLHVRRENAGRSSTVPFCERCATSTPDSSRARAATISSNKRHRCHVCHVQ